MVSDLLEGAGLVCLVVAAWWWAPLAGLVAAGVALIVFGLAVDR